jgi:hypothetical protein
MLGARGVLLLGLALGEPAPSAALKRLPPTPTTAGAANASAVQQQLQQQQWAQMMQGLPPNMLGSIQIQAAAVPVQVQVPTGPPGGAAGAQATFGPVGSSPAVGQLLMQLGGRQGGARQQAQAQAQAQAAGEPPAQSRQTTNFLELYLFMHPLMQALVAGVSASIARLPRSDRGPQAVARLIATALGTAVHVLDQSLDSVAWLQAQQQAQRQQPGQPGQEQPPQQQQQHAQQQQQQPGQAQQPEGAGVVPLQAALGLLPIINRVAAAVAPGNSTSPASPADDADAQVSWRPRLGAGALRGAGAWGKGCSVAAARRARRCC